MIAVKHSARVVLLVLITAILAQLIGWFSGLVAITESFPTASHNSESGLVLVCLFSALAALASGYARFIKAALVVIGALAFFGVAGLVIHIRVESPLGVAIFWGLTNLLVVLMLGWILILGYTTKTIDWRELFISMTCSYMGLIYLGLTK